MDSRQGRPRDWLLLLALLALGVGLGNPKFPLATFTTSLIRSILLPPVSWADSVFGGISDFNHGVFTAADRTATQRELTRRADSADALQQRVWELEKENQRLRDIFKTMPSLPGRPIAGAVIAFYPKTMTATLSVGRSQGINVGDPVLAPQGLAGVVSRVDTGTCQVLMTTANRFSVGARVARTESRTAGIVSGGQGDLLLMDHLPDSASVAAGDVVITSGVGTLYPKGLVIGTVSRVWKDPSYGLLRAWVKPAVRYDTLEEAIVLR